MKLSMNLPSEENTRWTPEAAESLIGQRFHVLAFGQAYLARVTHAELYDQGASVQITSEVETPEEEPLEDPAFTGPFINEVEDGITYPCQPIGCDSGYHLKGCVFDTGRGPESDG